MLMVVMMFLDSIEFEDKVGEWRMVNGRMKFCGYGGKNGRIYTWGYEMFGEKRGVS